jgi:transcriptional regulator with XRE-family HTH domain
MEQAMKDMGLTQTLLSKRTGITQPSISDIMRGDRWPPSLFNGWRIARALGRPLEDFLEEVESESPDPLDTATIPRAQLERFQAIQKHARALVVALAKDGDLPLRPSAKKAIAQLADALDQK